jgi:hypothetical protein
LRARGARRPPDAAEQPAFPADRHGYCTPQALKAMHRALLLLLTLVAACASTDNLRPGAERPATVTDSINLSGFPPEFRKGFTDGCSAARWGRTAAPKAEGQYAVGWRDGFDYCKPRPTQ